MKKYFIYSFYLENYGFYNNKSMNFYKKREMSSRQGKAINNMYPSVFCDSVRRPRTKEIEPVNYSSFTDMLNELENQRIKEEEESKRKRVDKFTSSFKAISREQYGFSTRNKTGSPKVGLYNPNWNAVRPRTTYGPRLSTKTSAVKQANIFTPICIQDDYNCNRSITKQEKEEIKIEPKIEPKVEAFDKTLKRTITNINEYNKNLEEKQVTRICEPKKPMKYMKSPIKFARQLKRKDFVSETDPPNEKRFDFIMTETNAFSKNRRVKSFSFEKSEGRKDLFEHKDSLPPYDRNEEATMHRLSVSVLEFDKMVDRQELVHKHMLNNPDSIELSQYEEAYFKQSTVRGPHKIPLMSTVTPRDDSMYRVNDTYILNVPEIQTAEAKPKFHGDISISLLKDKFRFKYEE